MIRAILVVCAVVLAAAGALAGAGIFDSFLRSDEIQRDRIKRIAATGIQDRLSERYGEELRFFIVGRDIDPERWDFRGQVVQGAEAQPLYGVARRVCAAEDASGGACWELERLAVNGAELIEAASVSATAGGGSSAETGGDFGTATSRAGPGADPNDGSAAPTGPQIAAPVAAEADPTPELAASAAESLPRVAAAPADDGQQASLTRSATGAQDAPAPTHVVSGSEVNMRDGPGLEFETIGVIYQGQELARLEDQGEWARFRLIGGEKDGVEAWLFTPLTRPRG